MAELEEENAFYDEHRAEFREKYMDKWLVITGRALWGVYDRFTAAVDAAMENLEHGKIMIHKPADDGRVIPMPMCRIEYPDGAERPEPEIASMTYTSGGGHMVIPYD